jgi:hypothetical protein
MHDDLVDQQVHEPLLLAGEKFLPKDRNFNRMTPSILGRCTPVSRAFSSSNARRCLYSATPQA